jgi:hypothetical protein
MMEGILLAQALDNDARLKGKEPQPDLSQMRKWLSDAVTACMHAEEGFRFGAADLRGKLEQARTAIERCLEYEDIRHGLKVAKAAPQEG